MDLTGRSLKQYLLVGQLGAGGMGVVYRARDTVLGREAAVKVLPPDRLQDDEARERFFREARAASALNHPNVVTVYEIGSADGIDFIAMELVSGHTLHQLLGRRRLRVAEACDYALQAAEGLTRAHAAGVVHRDIKPGNLVISDDGLLKVLDFGLARLHEASRRIDGDRDTATRFATRVGAVMGTLAYMSPEQARGDEAGPASDIFSLGVVIFEMLTGELPFAGDSQLARMHNLHFTPPKDLRTLSPDVPDELARIVAGMLEKDLNARYASMADVRRDLKRAAGSTTATNEPAPASGPATAEPARRTESPRLMRVAMFAALAIGGTAGAAWLARPGDAGPTAASSAPAAADPGLADATTPRDLFLRARALLDRFDRDGNPDRAIPLLERAVEIDASYAMGYATLTEAYLLKNQVAPDAQWPRLMLQSAQRAMALNPEMGAAHIAMGLALAAQPGKAAEAEAAFRRAIELDPQNFAPHFRLASVLPREANAERSAELRRALALDTGNWTVLQELGVFHYRAAQYAQAAEYWERARTASPDNVRVLANLAAAYHMLARYEDSASTLQRAIEIQPSGQLFTNLGTLRFFQGRYNDAIAPFEKAVELSPNRFAYWGNLADAYRWSPGNKPRARATYERAIQLLKDQLAAKSDDLDLRSRLALYQAKAGETEAARAFLSGFDRAASTPAVVLFRLAVASDVIGERGGALSLLEHALRAGYAETEVRSEPELVSLRNDLRYHRIIAKLPGQGSR